MVVAPDGATIVSGSYDSTVRVWRAAGGPVASVESGGTSPYEVPVI